MTAVTGTFGWILQLFPSSWLEAPDQAPPSPSRQMRLWAEGT